MTYDSRDFVERNRDALDRELSQAMYECDHPILKVLFTEGKGFLTKSFIFGGVFFCYCHGIWFLILFWYTVR